MQVFDKDTFTKDDPIGEVQVPLWTIPDLLQETFAQAELGKITKSFSKGKVVQYPGSRSQKSYYTYQENDFGLIF